MDVFKLSRDWFNYCFENPEKITPTHTALYFFIIEHNNRLAWKQKFGLPTEMAKEAIGIKNYRTYTKALNDLEDWGFIKFVQRSKNQYSSNVIEIVKNAKAHTKALDKAMQKHGQKQSKSTVSIDIPINQEPINNNISWKKDFEIYKEDLRAAYLEIINDKTWIQERETYHPKVDIKLSIDKSLKDFWATEAGWQNKKRKRIKDINWKSTFNQILTNKANIVWKK